MIIVDRPEFKLEATVRKVGSYHSLELRQLHPNAQHPYWRRVTQINLTDTELALLIGRLAGELE